VALKDGLSEVYSGIVAPMRRIFNPKIPNRIVGLFLYINLWN